MARFFNTTGPCFPERHYFLPPQTRLNNAQLDRYVRDELYWVLHAPRQTGKTTFLITWMRELNLTGQACACYVSVEVCQGVPEVSRVMPMIATAMRHYARDFGVPIPTPPPAGSVDPGSQLSETLKNWAELCAPRPLVVLFDEVDVLEGPALVSFLRQLRGGFASRGIGKFPVSVALVGMRDLRDYLAQSKDGIPINPGSPFNIKEDSATLSNFTRNDIDALLGQHTAETGQVFEPGAGDAIWYWTAGQPYLVNALAKECVWRITNEDFSTPISAQTILQAKENLIQARTTHLDALAERLRQADVKRVVQTILTGEADPTMAEGREFELCLDLGLVTLDQGEPIIANPLYREVLPRSLSYGMQIAVPRPEFAWQRADGALDMNVLLKEFQDFWREHADTWEVKADYPEAFPHLLLMAFLQRVLNGGGRITREYAAGRGRMDLFVEFAEQQFIIEIKLVKASKGRLRTLEEALAQVTRYRTVMGGSATATYIALFDRTEVGRKLRWDERLTWDVVDTSGGQVTVVGL